MQEKPRTVLIVDDDKGIRDQLSWALESEYHVISTGSANEALALCESDHPDLVLLDITLSERDNEQTGIDILPRLIENDPLRKVIIVSGSTNVVHPLDAVHRGAVDFYQKPINLDELKAILARALYVQKLERENQSYRDQLLQKARVENILGSSEPMQEVFRLIEAVAPSDYTVLVTGLSGTGKELVARAIHDKSDRRDEAFVPINCGAIPEELLESELFGHEKGSFTGAQMKKQGKFQVANNGTVFLDEIGDLSGKLQVKLLRFLQDHKIEPVGSTQQIELNVRVLAATNIELEEAVAERRFREDLFYRLSVITIRLPALKDRGDDLRLLAEHFLSVYARENNKRKLTFTEQAHQALSAHAWPGNIRELENRIKRAVILTAGQNIRPADLGMEKAGAATPTQNLDLAAAREQAERETIQRAMTIAGGNVSRAAKILGISRTTLYYLLEKVGISKSQGKSD